MANNTVNSREAGLVAGLILGKAILGTEDLHYGLWTDDLEVRKENLPRAQEQHSEFILDHIPQAARSVLDVGCGVGVLAAKMIARGLHVDCVSPSRALTERTRERLNGTAKIFECNFEDLSTERRYDLVLFSESFQYIKLESAIAQSVKHLNPGGHVLICDFFKTDAEGKSPLKGGRPLRKFYAAMDASPLERVADIDITDLAAPNLDLIDDILKTVGKPLWQLGLSYLENKRPLISKFLRWRYRTKIEKLDSKYFNGARNGASFKTYKSYRLLLYRLR